MNSAPGFQARAWKDSGSGGGFHCPRLSRLNRPCRPAGSGSLPLRRPPPCGRPPPGLFETGIRGALVPLCPRMCPQAVCATLASVVAGLSAAEGLSWEQY